MGEMSQSDVGKVHGRMWRVPFALLSALVLGAIIVGVFVQRGRAPQAREVTGLRRAVNGRELIGSYQWYSPTNIFVLGERRNNPAVYSLNVQTGVKSQFEWLIPYVSKEGLWIYDWVISWPLQRLSVLSHTDGDTGPRVSSFDLTRHLEQHADVEGRYPEYVYLPSRDSWAAMFGSAELRETVRFYTAQKGITEIKPTPLVSGRVLGVSGSLIFRVSQEYPDLLQGRLEIDALRLGDDVTVEKHYAVLLPGIASAQSTPSPDGKWLLGDGLANRTTVGFMRRVPFIFSDQRQDEVFLAVNLETSAIINILKTSSPWGPHTPRWLPDGKSVSIVVDDELRVWKLFD